MFEEFAFRPLLHILLQISSLLIVHAFINICQSHVTLWNKTKKYNLIFCISVYMNRTSHLIIHDQVYICFVLFFSDLEVDIWLMRIRCHNATFSQQILSTVLCVCLYHCALVVALVVALEDQRSGFAGLVRGFFSPLCRL